MTLTPPAPGTIGVWSDLLCPFATVALHRLRSARDRLGVPLHLDHHVFALELFNGPHPRRGTDTSPTFVLPDGGTVTNPGIEVHWQGEWAAGFPVVNRSDPAAVDDLVRRAAA